MENVFEILLLIHHSVASVWNNTFLGSDLGHIIFNITKISLSYRNNPLIYHLKRQNATSTAPKQAATISPKNSLEAAWLNSSRAVITHTLLEL